MAVHASRFLIIHPATSVLGENSSILQCHPESCAFPLVHVIEPASCQSKHDTYQKNENSICFISVISPLLR